jgi:hypothetical protein
MGTKAINEPRSLNWSEVESIALRFRAAHAAGDIGALAILAVETFPHLIETIRSARYVATNPAREHA